jgi:hypothetical protein
VRPVLQLFPPVLVAALLLAARRDRIGVPRAAAHLGVALLCTAVVLAPRFVHNERE